MKDFCIKYKKAFIGAFLVSLLSFGYMLTHFTITIDEETWLLAEGKSNLWLYQGRFAIWLFNLFFTDSGRWVPFLWDFLAVMTWNAAGVLFAYGLFKDRKLKQWQMFFAFAYFSSLPFSVGEMMFFGCMNLQVCTGMAATAAAFVFSIQLWEKIDKKTFFIALLLLIYGISSYQAMVCVYLTAVAGYSLLDFLEDKKEKLFYRLCTGGIFCMAASVLYWCVNLAVWQITGTENYLTDNYVGWSAGNRLITAFKAAANIARISFAIPYHDYEIYGGAVIRCISILFMLYAVWVFFKKKEAKDKFWILFYSAVLYAAPFSLYVVLGTRTTHGRMLLGLSLAGAVQIYLVTQALNRRVLQKAAGALLSILLFFNVKYMNEIYYYSSMTYEKDCDIASALMHDIESRGMDYRRKPVVFVGMIEQDILPVKTLDAMGGSMFAWDEGNNTRMHDFLRCRGYAVLEPGKEVIDKAAAKAETMGDWPQEKGICELDDVVIVRLSEPTDVWYNVNHADRIKK